jgi:hypothetical protein
VHVQVHHGLSGLPSCIDDHPIAVIGEGEAPGYVPGDQEQRTEKVSVGLVDLIEADEVRVRDHEHVRRRLGGPVVEGRDPVILDNHVRRRVPRDDLTERARWILP